jgi:CBS domain-containing protein
MQVRDIMTSDPITLPGTASAAQAAAAMRDHDVGSILVNGDDGRLVGIVTDRDLAVRCMADGHDPALMKVNQLCTTDPATLDPSHSVEEAIRTMGDKHVRRMPVVKDHRAIGMVSLGDLAAHRDPDSLLGQISTAPANA